MLPFQVKHSRQCTDDLEPEKGLMLIAEAFEEDMESNEDKVDGMEKATRRS